MLFQQIKDLDNVILNLRKQLNHREQEVTAGGKELDDSRETIQSLKSEVERLKSRASPGPQLAEVCVLRDN